MSELRLTVMDSNNPATAVSCGIPTIDSLAKDAYCKTLLKQGLAYNILVDNYPVGSCMIKFVVIEDEEYCVNNPEYVAYEISYIAINEKFQRHGIGSRVLSRLIREAQKVAEKYPVRFLVINALQDKEDWYFNAGFKRYPKKDDPRYLGTIPMRMDFLKTEAIDEYSENFS